MDLNLIPLRIELRALLIARFCIYIPWKGWKCWSTKLTTLLWEYQTAAVNKKMWNYNDAEPDLTAPDFGLYTEAVKDPYFTKTIAIQRSLLIKRVSLFVLFKELLSLVLRCSIISVTILLQFVLLLQH